MAVVARLPGVRIEAVPPPPVQDLPPMDVAVFVGFAAGGPVHRPVAIEGLAQYQAVFGGDLDLALDPLSGERVHAHLGPAVRTFFANGGRRCWVIRVTRTVALEAAWSRVAGRTPVRHRTATANRFAVPGVLLLAGEGARAVLTPAQVQARSLGSWSDPLQVSTALLSRGFALTGCTRLAAPAGAPAGTVRVRLRTTASLVPGDLVELGEGAGAAVSSALRRSFARCERAVPSGFEATLCAVFAPLTAPAAPVIGSAKVPGLMRGVVPATIETPPRADGVPAVSRLRFTAPAPAALAVGHWVRWSAPGRVVWLRVDQHLGQGPGPQGPAPDLMVEGPAWRELNPAMPHPVPSRAALLTLDLRVLAGPGSAARMSGVGLTPGHPAAWWRQLSDDLYYAPAADRPGFGSSPAASARTDAFPLAALDGEVGAKTPRTWIPLGVEAPDGPLLGALPQAVGPLYRDGLARFNAELFLDPDLAGRDTATLMAQADDLRFVADTPRYLYGIHAALSIGGGEGFNEVSLIAVPDAVHPGWKWRPAAAAPPPRPVPAAAPAHWSVHRGPCAAVAPGLTLSRPDFGRFLDRGTHPLAPPVLRGPAAPVPRGTFTLTWEAGVSDGPAASLWVLEEAQAADFQDARAIYRGTGQQFPVQATREGNFYYQVTAWSGDERGPASNPLGVAVRDHQWVVKTWAGDTGSGARELLRIHQGLLRLAAASGELFAVLGLPRHYRAPEAIGYAARLRAAFPAAGRAEGGGWERRALSFGALYHPWIQYARPVAPSAGTAAPDRLSTGMHLAGAARVCPPDGLAIGVLAARARLRGAWIAPANEPLKDLVALTPSIESAAWLPLQEAGINLIRAEPRGFLTLAAATLSDEADWRSINVRRLFSLLRRLALRRGLSYVFEPNGDVLRRAVERGFINLLTDLFRRGAFAGATPDESFRVVTGGSVNTAADRDAGRFFVELRVAPALPLRFLAVRLVQRGERLTLMEES